MTVEPSWVARYVVDTKVAKLAVDTKLARFAVDTKFVKLDCERNEIPVIEETLSCCVETMTA